MSQYFIIFSASTPIFLIMGLGAAIRRAGWLSRETDDELVHLLIWILMPALILDRMLGNPALAEPSNLIIAPLAGAGFLCLGFLFCRLMALGLRGDLLERRTFAFGAGTYNYGYIALPMVLELFDDATVGVLFLHNVGYEIALWSIGLMVLKGEFSRKGILKGFNPVVIAVIVSVLMTVLGVDEWVPVFLRTSFTMVGATAIPIALLVTGALIFDHLEPKSLLLKPKFGVAACAMRLGVLPVVFLLIAGILPFSLELKQVIIVQAAMPCAVLPIVLAKRYGGSMTVAVEIVVATSLVSILTIPLWIQAGMQWLR